MAFFAGTLLFPNVCLFVKNPSISPQHIILYTFLAIECLKNREEFLRGVFRNPLVIPLGLSVASYTCTALFNGGLLSIDMYYGVRDIVDTFGYLIAAYIVGKNNDIHEFAKSIYPFIVICCFFGIIEGLLNANYPYKFINSAFPHYNGLYNLNSDISLGQSWRIRTCFTTKHPTAFGTFLMTMFLFYLPYIKKEVIPFSKLLLILGLLAVNIVMCGSRTALFCTLIGVALYIADRFSILVKIATIGLIILSFTAILGVIADNFKGGQGRGSSIDLRTQQLIFSVLTIEKSPIWGNGNKYASHNLFEENDAGQMRVEDSSGTDMGGLESVVFTLLIDRGFVGLISYYLLLFWIFWLFYRYRNRFSERDDAFIIVGAGILFLTLSGSIGNSSAFLFSILGLQLGNFVQEKEKQEDEEDANALPSADLHQDGQKQIQLESN
ncbi:MAG: O-antigen ligase family protein [Fibrobacter sp.]|nr:O-antigen ligase family protein [Fibrobacter sp.]